MPLKADAIIRSRRRTLSLEVTADARLVVRAPERTRDDFITRFIREKEDWIRKKQQEMTTKIRQTSPKRFCHGEAFLFLGKTYPLHIDYASEKRLTLTSPSPSCQGQAIPRFIMSGKDLADPAAAFEAWYRRQARKYIDHRARETAAAFGLCFRQLKITGAKKRWGSCSSGKTINFSWRLIMAPPEVVDYVVAHELAHLQHMNHSREFWRFVGQMCPDYKTQRKWLRAHGHLLGI